MRRLSNELAEQLLIACLKLLSVEVILSVTFLHESTILSRRKLVLIEFSAPLRCSGASLTRF